MPLKLYSRKNNFALQGGYFRYKW